jgi:hypothetical protein
MPPRHGGKQGEDGGEVKNGNFQLFGRSIFVSRAALARGSCEVREPFASTTARGLKPNAVNFSLAVLKL